MVSEDTLSPGAVDAASSVSVRRLSLTDIGAAARLHAEMADVQFIARGGPPLLRQYYRAWMSTGNDISLGAFDSGGEMVGVLLGSSSPAAHYRAMLRRGGWRVALGMALASVGNLSFGRELLTTRGVRYARALGRRAGGLVRRGTGGTGAPEAAGGTGSMCPGTEAAPGPARPEGLGGEITHVVVTTARRRTGAGRALVDAAAGLARQSGLSYLELVTIPGSDASAFYERLGWEPAGVLASSSGEHFARYRYRL